MDKALLTGAFVLAIIKGMKQISQVVLPDNLQIDLLFQNGKLGYTFDHDGKPYGTSVKIPSKKVADIAACCLVLFTNALETKKELIK